MGIRPSFSKYIFTKTVIARKAPLVLARCRKSLMREKKVTGPKQGDIFVSLSLNPTKQTPLHLYACLSFSIVKICLFEMKTKPSPNHSTERLV